MECQLSANDSFGWKKIFSFHCESHGEFILGRHQKKKWKAIKKKKTLLTSMFALFPLENGYQVAFLVTAFFFLKQNWIYWIVHLERNEPYSGLTVKEDSRKHGLLFWLCTWEFSSEWSVGATSGNNIWRDPSIPDCRVKTKEFIKND